MKKVYITALSALVMFSVAACGTRTPASDAEQGKDQVIAQNDSKPAPEDSAKDDSAKPDAQHNGAEAGTVREYDYKDGVLTTVVDEKGNPRQTDFVIDGIILIGNRHRYEGTDDIDGALLSFVKKGYPASGINSSFYLNEYIQFYIDTKYAGSADDVKILITPHKTVEEYEKMQYSDLTSLAEEKGTVLNYQTPDAENHKYVAEGYVNMDFPEGRYDILFTYREKLAYFINITETKEQAE